MNLPIKLVDLVTLLFISLLVVIIVFIILQRNIKRFKLRNIKDPHFLTCKSIPKEIKDAIRRKNEASHIYKEPPNLITSTYMDNPNDETKLFLTRMKVFDTSKHLEYALNEYGLKRPKSIKFEEFISNILTANNSKMPNDLLKEFYKLYQWAMIDPMPFTKDNLRRLNRLINSIIDYLATIQKQNLEQLKILQYKLDLNEQGDFDLSNLNKKSTKLFMNSNNIEQMSNNDNKSKQVKFGDKASSTETTKKSQSKNVFARRLSKDKTSHEMNELPKSMSSNKKESSSKNDHFDREKLLNESNERSFESNKPTQAKTSKKLSASKNVASSPSTASSSSILNRSDHDSDHDNRWSQTNDSTKTFDSENEQVPLVSSKKSTHHKKKSNHSDITIVPTVVSATPTGFVTTKLSKKNSHTSLVASAATPTNNIQMSTINTNNDFCAENEAFNKTFDNNF